ncbi:enoyl-CoA hydratase-related protein [Nocardioides pantholopis]|uniref:enoyl-CoA hydratase-related protein n=1 Tax=Nocardioides pantholopis TaxID=2483798 RepID=UPI000FD8640A|nr:enoyl-CoA hydratase-related protein [Nocardioides pantholopis]
MSCRDLVEQLYRALGAGDAALLAQVLDPGFTGRSTAGLPHGLGGTFESPESMREDFWWRIGRLYRLTPRVEELLETDEGAVVTGTYVGTARSSGRPLEAAFTHRIVVRDGRITHLDQVTDSAAWHAALGEELTTMRLTVEGGLATLCLARPEVRNAIDLRLAEDLLVAARRIAADRGVRALLICGDGPALTVGGDLGYIVENAGDDLGALLRTMTTPFHAAFTLLSQLDVPIVTAAHGAVVGGGLGLVFAGDIVIASDDARFVSAFAALGLSGDGGGTWHLPRRIGPARAAEVYLENRPVSAAEALEWGLVNEVVAADDLRRRATERAQRLVDGPTRAFGAMRRLLRDSWSSSLSDQLAAETDTLSRIAATADAHRAVSAFLAKTRPTFEGA